MKLIIIRFQKKGGRIKFRKFFRIYNFFSLEKKNDGMHENKDICHQIARDHKIAPLIKNEIKEVSKKFFLNFKTSK